MLYFVRFLFVCGLPLDPCWLYPTEGILQGFVAFLSATCAAATIKGHLAGLKHFLATYGPVEWGGFVHLQRQLKGIQRVQGKDQQQKRPVTVEMLLLWVCMLGGVMSSWLQCVMLACVFGVFGMLRRSNLVPGGAQVFGATKHLLRSDVEFVPELYALRLTVRASKTIQYRDRVHVLYISGSQGGVLDPVRLYHEYVAAHPAAPDAPFFMFRNEAGVLVPLTFDGLSSGVKQLVQRVGLDPTHYATHSLRRGGARAALQSGLAPYFTMFQGDWKSDCYLRYYSVTQRDKLNITSVMLKQLHAHVWGK